MFKNIFQTPDSLKNALLQAVRSGVESLRTVLSNNEASSRRAGTGAGGPRAGTASSSLSPSTTTSSRIASLAAAAEEAIAPTGRVPRLSRDRAESWTTTTSSSSSSGGANNTSTYRKSVDENHPFSNTTTSARPGSAATITDSVAESIKSFGKELSMGLGGLGLTTPSSGAGAQNTSATAGMGQAHHRNSHSGSSSSSRTRVWNWNGQETTTTTTMTMTTDVRGSGSGDVMGASGRALKTGVKTEAAAKETEVILNKIRMQQDAAVARAKRMPEVEKMAQRRHVDTAMEMKAEAKQLKVMEQSMDEMTTVSENIQRKLVGLEATIAKLEMNAEVMSLADWKKSKVSELDKYMETKRKELWDKAEMLATRSEQFQREESARKLQLYENQFERDMAHFRRSKEEQEQELWKSIEESSDGTEGGGTVSWTSDTLDNVRAASSKTLSLSTTGKRPTMPPTTTKIQLAAVPSSILSVRAASAATGILDGMDQPVLTVGGVDQDEERREKEDLDKFLGSASENDDNSSEDIQESEMDSDEDDDDEDDDDEEEVDSSSEDDTMDPIEMARKARASAASSSSGSKASEASWAKVLRVVDDAMVMYLTGDKDVIQAWKEDINSR
ncbi:hypothetical protein BG006_010839, partial [Podila minutissima]